MTRKITDLKRKTVATTGAEAFMGRAVALQIAGREVILVADSMVACNEVMKAIGIALLEGQAPDKPTGYTLEDALHYLERRRDGRSMGIDQHHTRH